MKQIKFTKEVVVEKSYTLTLKAFMDNHFKEALRYGNELDVYVQCGTHSGYMRRVMNIPLLPEELSLDFNDVDNVKLVLKRYLKEE